MLHRGRMDPTHPAWMAEEGQRSQGRRVLVRVGLSAFVTSIITLTLSSCGLALA